MYPHGRASVANTPPGSGAQPGSATGPHDGQGAPGRPGPGTTYSPATGPLNTMPGGTGMAGVSGVGGGRGVVAGAGALGSVGPGGRCFAAGDGPPSASRLRTTGTRGLRRFAGPTRRPSAFASAVSGVLPTTRGAARPIPVSDPPAP